MLMESSFSSSVETSLLKASEYQDPFAAYDWVSLAETYQMIHKFPEQSQVSFLEAVPVPDAMNLNESKHPKLQVSCPEQSVMHKVSEKSLTSLVYSRRKRSVRPGGTAELNSQENKKQDDSLDDSIVPVHNPGESKKRKIRFNNCLVYSRKKKRGKSSCITGEANGSFTESHIEETKRNGDKSDVLLMYSRRKQRRKSIGARVNGFLVYSRKKRKVKSRGTFTGHDPRETKKIGDELSIIASSHALSVPEKYANSISHVEQMRSALELKDGTQVTEVTCSSDGTNDSCSSLKSSSELASGSSKTGEDEATDCDSSDAEASETDTDGSSSPFRQCKHCDKPGTVEKMLICDECEEAYHTNCCGVRMKEVADIDDWLCPSCLKGKSSKTKIKGKVSRERNWRVTEPFVIGIRIGKEFQADVPDWSGPTMSDTSFVGEPLEIDQSAYMHDLKKVKNGKKPRSAVNWLQCREEDINGDICGKWRRAPRSEVQTKDWECFCCVFWDPSHADCAVPQELETSEILKQLKYIKMLRPRLDTKRRKLGPKGRNRSHNKGKSS